MAAEYELDDLDRKILALLMENAKRPYTELGAKLFVSGGTIHVRMNKLIAAGVVRGQTLVVDHTKIGYDVSAFLGIYLKGSGLYNQAAEYLKGIQEIVSAHYTTGVYSIFARVVCRDTDHLRDVLQRIQAFDGIQRTETFISLEETIDRPVQVVSQEELAELRATDGPAKSARPGK
ncbi:Lrp/AsnC family transcriptional regulator for asnA, asnC and gidA [Lewinella marina]|uniref:Transcriptional regulator AsnC n=1 Tax=Neolewinella marina TaxID=438751 RepID=A0A2G0CI79_9BACT|nr:Lrp/AsnC ligand binding domain-containing protein [Neolewinella marina]NJB85184.1 Lrp/AsnC family transcriptional regulator for asnA, asnC and gidA [Neolewinella marina]PHK99683.1 transcriptional regulator AsnC [Neolewinella marina]